MSVVWFELYLTLVHALQLHFLIVYSHLLINLLFKAESCNTCRALFHFNVLLLIKYK